MLLLSTLQQFDIDPANFFLLLATAGLTLFFLLAALAAPLLGAVTESAYVLRHKSFYDKCALQITQTAFAIGMFTFLTLGAVLTYSIIMLQPETAGAAPLVPAPGENAGLPIRLWARLGPMLFFLPPLKGLILLFVYLVSWSFLKKHRTIHLLIGWSAALSTLGVLFCGLLLAVNIESPLLLMFLLNNPLPVLQALLTDFFSSPSMPLLYLGLVCAGLAAGAGLAQLWLIMRRFKADYGRDYYAFAMRYCARVALLCTLASTVIGGIVYFLLRRSIPPELTQPQDIGVTVIAAGLPLSCCLLWLSIAKSESPLRHKPGAFFACVFLFIALCAQFLMLANTFPMI
jgi:hypothetical protein